MLSHRWSRGRRLVGVAASAAAVAALSGCGADLHPGAAATVNGTTITDESIDNLAQAFCAYIEEGEKQEAVDDQKPAIAIGDLKLNLLNGLVAFELTDTAAQELGIGVPPAQIEKSLGDLNLPDALDADEVELLEGFFDNLQENELQNTMIEEKESADYLQKYFSKADVEVSPSFGRWDGEKIEPGTGSLSDPVSTTASPTPPPGQDPVAAQEAQAAAQQALEALPPSQVCG
ncbi:MAG: SurA N-terminal domain-containing protein [Nocardioidaceae bacterium]|nr:SurA N-terminal domain-containing protein [Nocardioidaceae bacterium]